LSRNHNLDDPFELIVENDCHQFGDASYNTGSFHLLGYFVILVLQYILPHSEFSPE
jgi:hypothetical protein